MRAGSLTSTPLMRTWRKYASSGVVLDIGIALGGVMVTRLLISVTQIVLARLLGLADFGLYTAVFALLGPVLMVATLGLDTWLLRAGGKVDSLNTAISQVFSVRLFAVVTLSIIGVAAVLISRQPGMSLSLILVAVLVLICELLLMTAHTALRAQVHNRASTLLQVSVPALFIVLLWVFWNDQISVLTVTEFRLLACLVGVALLVWLLRSNLRIIWPPVRLLPMLQEARIYFASDLLSHITLKADLLLVSLLLGTVAAGIYSPALMIVNMTFLVPLVIWQILLPIISQQQSDLRRLRRLIVFGLGSGLLYGGLCAALFLGSAEWLVHLLFGAEYLDAIPLIQVMSVIPLFKSFNFCFTTLLVAYDAQLLRTKLQAIGAAFNAIGNLVAIPMVGLIGVAWVNMTTELVLFLCYGIGVVILMRQRQERQE